MRIGPQRTYTHNPTVSMTWCDRQFVLQKIFSNLRRERAQCLRQPTHCGGDERSRWKRQTMLFICLAVHVRNSTSFVLIHGFEQSKHMWGTDMHTVFFEHMQVLWRHIYCAMCARHSKSKNSQLNSTNWATIAYIGYALTHKRDLSWVESSRIICLNIWSFGAHVCQMEWISFINRFHSIQLNILITFNRKRIFLLSSASTFIYCLNFSVLRSA